MDNAMTQKICKMKDCEIAKYSDYQKVLYLKFRVISV